MASVGRSLVLFGRSATRMRATNNRLLRGVHFDEGPGLNMPFQTQNKTRLLIVMVAYLGTCFALPFVAVRFQMAKAANS
ncbi:predicted protein [Nematostella vectensis]|uniref:Cytochrome c oxidase subunit 7C, mitochondrial n=1 Tax=Nematostella vectensis TaxID=45351 RepID=A7RPT2_NEMVE|nr:cytochrome c oxidase subunit 7C, mitochondrial [Nematostella vectensis]EDO46630.1 predicted protein [Nematostella vectensis]|eukprot:XP_001638693.1 predicted protein [Nematostella vectensis]